MTTLKVVDRALEPVSLRGCAGAGRRVRRLMGEHTTCGELDPFLLLEEFEGRQEEVATPRIPCRGYLRITLVVSGSLRWVATHPEHGDQCQQAEDGDIVAMHCAMGMLVSEEALPSQTPRLGGGEHRVRLIELWVRSSRESLAEEPRASTYRRQEMPKVKGDGWDAQVLVGRFDDRLPELINGGSPMRIILFSLKQGGTVEYSVPEGWQCVLYVVDGAVEFQSSMSFHPKGRMVCLGTRHTQIEATASQERPARFLLCAARPLMQGGFLKGTIAGSSEKDVERVRGSARFARFIETLDEMAEAFAAVDGPCTAPARPPQCGSPEYGPGPAASARGAGTPRPPDTVVMPAARSPGQPALQSSSPGSAAAGDAQRLRAEMTTYDQEMRQFLGQWKSHCQALMAKIKADPGNLELRQQYQEKSAKFNEYNREYMAKWEEYRAATGQGSPQDGRRGSMPSPPPRDLDAAAPRSGVLQSGLLGGSATIRHADDSASGAAADWGGAAASGRGGYSASGLAAGSARAGSPRLSISQLENWTKVKILGKGAYGTVWSAMLDNGQTVAMKEVTIGVDLEKADRDAFEAEFQLMQRLAHPNIVRYLGHTFTDDTLCIFLEYVTGGSVSGVIRDVKKHGALGLPAVVARGYVRQVLEGLAYLHQETAGRPVVVHRDIKGENLLLSPEGDVKLADFGTAKMLEKVQGAGGKGQGSMASGGTAGRTLVGTPLWMAPEVISPETVSGGYGTECDIWSLGCTIIEMCGNTPWGDIAGGSPWQIMYSIVQAEGPPSGIPADIPDCLRAFLLEGCFPRDPRKRLTALQLRTHRYVTCPDKELSDADPMRSPRHVRRTQR